MSEKIGHSALADRMHIRRDVADNRDLEQRVVGKVLSGVAAGRAEVLSLSGDSVGSAGKILLVDDEAANLQLLKALLTREGYSVVTASDGEEALAAVESADPDLVLMDVLMPKLSGYDMCER